ncbi:MAG: S41 family peptidase [Chlorobi bacterium]|nr:S41 family peptidase [Chlorobiota bacterium]
MKRTTIVAGLSLALILLGWVSFDQPGYLELSRAVELFGMVVREVHEQYINTVEPSELVEEAIEHMLNKLDPYTEFYREDRTNDLDFLLQGRYIGVGIRVGSVDSVLTVLSVTDGSSAHKAGVRIGDIIVAIDTVKIHRHDAEYARRFLRGPQGSTVTLHLLRGPDTLHVQLQRQEIIVRNVTYAGITPEGVGVIRLERFSRRAPEEFRTTLDSLLGARSLRGLVIDLRDNPGGLLDAAVSIAEMFLREGDTIVVTKSRNQSNVRAYVARSMPYVDTVLPLIVIVNSRSASASEILAGALQDNDRAVIIGDTTLGKGLVQSVVSLPYNAALKLTTARYYTPSGRSIQRVANFCPDCWIHRNPDGETQRAFTTLRSKRPIFSGTGIVPDIVLESAELDSVPGAIGQSAIWWFATHFTSLMQMPPVTLDTGRLLDAFIRFVEKERLETPALLARSQELAQLARQEGWSLRTVRTIERLQNDLRMERARLIRERWLAIAKVLEREIRSRFCSDRQLLQMTELSDPIVAIATSLVNDLSYRKYLSSEYGKEH